MTTQELRARIFENLNCLLDNKEAMLELDSYLSSLKHRMEKNVSFPIPPCLYSQAEVIQRLRSTEKDALAGKGFSTEEVLAASEEWV